MGTVERQDKTPRLSRRDFLKATGLAAGGLVAAQPAPRQPLPHPAERPGPHRPSGRVRRSITHSFCHVCLWKCGITVTTVDGRVVKIDGNPNNPSNRGKMCARGQAGVMELYDPDRLKTPLIRTGERGDGKYRQATWDEALQYAADGLNKVKEKWGGPEAVAWFAHNGGDYFFAEYLPAAWGSPNAGKPSEAVCTTPRERAAALTMGRSIGAHEPVDWDETKCVVLMGFHIGENAHVTHMAGLAEARARGARAHRRGSPRVDGGLQGRHVAADQAGHRHGPAPGLDERAHHRGAVRQGLRGQVDGGLSRAGRPCRRP